VSDFLLAHSVVNFTPWCREEWSKEEQNDTIGHW